MKTNKSKTSKTGEERVDARALSALALSFSEKWRETEDDKEKEQSGKCRNLKNLSHVKRVGQFGFNLCSDFRFFRFFRFTIVMLRELFVSLR